MRPAIYLLALLLLAGCYNERKAQREFNKAALSYPIIPAEYCASAFAPHDSHVRDTVYKTDTAILAGEQFFDTTYISGDTVLIVRTKGSPSKIITRTIQITDTIYRENTAALKACEIKRDQAIALSIKKDQDADKYKGRAASRGKIMWGLIALIVAGIIYKIIKLYARSR